jgi:hypothetical protein
VEVCELVDSPQSTVDGSQETGSGSGLCSQFLLKVVKPKLFYSAKSTIFHNSEYFCSSR